MLSDLTQYDPWGPISAVLYSTRDSDFVQDTIALTGVPMRWPSFADEDTNKTRIRKLRAIIDAAYRILGDEEKGLFAQTVARRLVAAEGFGDLRTPLEASLNNIGWTVAEGTLKTQDVVLSEQFFPPGTQFDAYVAIRSVLEKASAEIFIVDAYVGSTIFLMLSAASRHDLKVRLLTLEKAVKPDFRVEAQKFKAQFPRAIIEVRTTSEFHDRFIIVDGTAFYHVGASIKDAGTRAFLISKLQDQPIIDLLRQHVESAWNRANQVT